MSKPKTLIFIGAHPDDETFGMGSTLARYAASGVKVYYVCATRGEEGTVSAERMKEYATIGDLRSAELECAAKVLGLAGVIYLGYRDSGMPGSQSNKRPNALALAPIEKVSGRIVKIIRELKPDVVITHDPSGGYGHPDHIATHNATVKAFYAAGDAKQYSEAGPAFQPHKLYFGVRSHKLMRLIVKLMPLFGKDPHRFGRNNDIDLSGMVSVEYPIHAVISIKQQILEIRNRAAACHASQGCGRRRGPFMILRILEKFQGARDYFTRDHPPPASRYREKDLFEGVR